MDELARRRLQPLLGRFARAAEGLGLRPVHVTLLGLAAALGAAAAAALGAWWAALGLWLASRLLDGVDGVLARLRGEASDVGGFLDIMADFTAYGAFVVAVAVAVPGARVACAVLLLAYYLNGAAFLAISSLAEKRSRDAAPGERSLQFVGGLTEGVETVLAHAAMALAGALRVAWVDDVVWVFAALVFVTVAQRIRFGLRVLRD